MRNKIEEEEKEERKKNSECRRLNTHSLYIYKKEDIYSLFYRHCLVTVGPASNLS